MPGPTLALVTCVHDEEAALPSFLAYHEALGVERAYVYLDRCRDRSREIVEDSAIGVAIPSDRDPRTRFLLEYQNVCAADAKRRAEDDGLEWLMHVDADEFAWGQPPEVIDASPDDDDPRALGDLRAMVGRADAETEVVRLATLEALPELGAKDAADLQYFQSPERPVARRMLDPRSGRRVVIQRLLGHDLGKSVVRTASELHPTTAHHWRTHDGAEPRTEPLGTHLHFPATSPRQWRTKYAKLAFEPGRWPEGEPVPFPKQAWKQVTPRMTETEAAEYFTRWVAMAPTEIHDLVERGHVRHLPLVGRVLRAAEFAP